MSKWICTIAEGVAGFVIWSFLAWWLGHALPWTVDPSVNLSTAAVGGLVMAVVYARRGLDAHEGRGKPERTAFGSIYSAMTFVICALGWAVLIFYMQMPGGGH